VERVTNSLQVTVPQSYVDEGDGVVSFPNGLTITDGSVQRNGTSYDINSLDISRYGNQLTGDHEDKLSSLIGEVIGVVKQDGRVVVNKIRYAVKENPYARLAYDLLRGGFSKNFSTETIGPKPGHDGVWWNSELVGLSQVVTQNNYNAHVNSFNKVVHNSLEQAKQDGLDVTGIEEKIVKSNSVEEENKMEEKEKTQVTETETKETETKTPEVEETKAEDAKVETTEEKKAPAVEDAQEDGGKKVAETAHDPNRDEADKKAETSKTTGEVKNQTETEETKKDVEVEADKKAETETKTEVSEEQKETNKEEKMEEDKKVETQNSTLTAEQVTEIVANALKPLNDELVAVKAEAKNAFDKSAKAPEFKKESETAKNSFEAMDVDTRFSKQVEAAYNHVRLQDPEALKTLREINKINLEGLKQAGIAKNAMTLDDLGNFIIPAEMYKEIAGHRNDYTALLNVTEWKDTLSLEFAWLERVGDIDMQNVAIGVDLGDGLDGDDDARLKPISEYSAVPRRSELEELAAVTVVANSATRFAAVDLLADAAKGYRNDYDRKRAQLVIARLEQAVDSTGYSVPYNPSNDVDALTAWLDAVTAISDTTLTGTLIFNARTFAELKSRALKAGANGPLSEILTTGDLPTVWGYRFIVVPNDLMPSLGGSENIKHKVYGQDVTINHAVYFADLTTFTGRTSGGLFYDVSNSASYEVSGTTRSAYQRNELVLRGSFFRGGAVMDKEVVAGVRQGAGANVS
jgi:hypothetical protein